MNNLALTTAALMFSASAVLADANLSVALPPSADLVANGSFEAEGKDWGGNAFGEGIGRLIFTNGVSRLEMERGPGAVQLMQLCELGNAKAVRVAFRHRGYELAVAYQYYVPSETSPDGYETVKNDAGGDLGDYIIVKGADDWTLFEHQITISKKVWKIPGTRLRLQFLVWGGNEPRAAEIDDVSLVVVEEKTKEEAKEEYGFRVERLPKTIPYGPIKPVVAVKAEIKDGLLLKNGRPSYWVGNGCSLGSELAGPVGMWLSKVQGVSALSIPSHFEWECSIEGTNMIFSSKKSLQKPYIGQYREAERLGFLCDFFANGDYEGSPMRKMAERHPQLKEFHNDFGHYMNFDAGNPIGRELQIGKRQGFFQYVDDISAGAEGLAVLELSREPGPHPTNERVRRGFREWAKQKYKTLDVANRVWKQKFASWDEVLPLHLRETDVTGYMERILYFRQMRRDYPELMWDWLAYMQDDSTLRIRDAFSDISRELPHMKKTIDVRGHNMEAPEYAAIDPERVDPLEDLFYIHFQWDPFTYHNEPYDRATVLYQASFPLFSYSFFRTNTKSPIIDSEDIISVARVPKGDDQTMNRNDIGQLHATPWKFRLETEADEGMKNGWFKPEFDDAGWDNLAVGTCWDETEKYRSQSGVGWMRKKFIANARRLDWEDGSHQFFIYGKGVAQKGTVWLNGHKVGEVEGWDTPYRFDVGMYINYGGENEIVWRIDGSGFQNGLRFYCHILSGDKISQSTPFGEKQYRHMLWTFLMRGASGCWVWPWHEDKLRPYLPGLVRRLDSAAEIALPDLRHRTGDVAYLYGYLSNLGLPCVIGETHTRYLNWMCALEFLGLRTDVFGEQTFCREVTPAKYPFLVVPHTVMVKDETYAHIRDYVKKGGTLVITEDSLTRTFKTYSATNIRKLAGALPKKGAKYSVVERGKGRIITVKGEPVMEDIMRLMLKWQKQFGTKAVPKTQVLVTSLDEERREVPLIERILAGDDTRKVLYLANWGGMDHRVKITLPESVAGWKLAAQYEGKATVTGERTLETTIPSQDVVAFVLSKEGAEPIKNFAVSPTREKVFKHVVALNEAQAQPGQRRVLWPLYDNNQSVNKELYIYETDRIAAFGGVNEQKSMEEWTPELLAQYDLVVIPETWTHGVLRNVSFMNRLGEMLDDYVRKGGALFVDVHTPWSINVYCNTLTPWAGLSPWLGVALEGEIYDESRAIFGDPNQVWTDAITPCALTTGVKRYELYQARSLKLEPTAKAQPKAVIQLAGVADDKRGVVLTQEERGKGRIVINVSAMSFQPFRIEKADNAALLENIIGWLFKEEVNDEKRRAFKENLFLTEETLRQIAIEETE